jgi:hypothetical protein
MTAIGLIMNLLLTGLLVAALVVGLRLNRRLKVLRDSHDGFEAAVRELNLAAARAEQGLADLRAATDEATDLLADRIEKGRSLAAKLERHAERLDKLAVEPAPMRSRDPAPDPMVERRLGALLAAAREARPERLAAPPLRAVPEGFVMRAQPRRPALDDELFDDEPLTLDDMRGARR